MKKIIFYSLLVLVCISFFSVQSYNAEGSSTQDNSSQTLSDGWVMKLAPDTEKFVNVFFKTENLGCIFTGNYPVKRTTNGGDIWGYGTVPFLTGTNGAVYFNGSDIFMAGYNIIPPIANYSILFRSSNMGLNWDTAKISDNEQGHTPYHQVSAMYKNLGYMTISWYTFPYYKSNNGGYNWLNQLINPTPGNFVSPNCISYIDTNTVYGISNYYHGIGRCVTGLTNDHFIILKDGIFTKISVVDTNNILALNKNKFFRSTNAGANWDSTVFPVNLNSISFPDQNTGYMTGSNGKIFKSTNKGATWITQSTLTTDSLVDCCFINSLTGYVIGYNGTLLKTTDGGGPSAVTISGLVRYADNSQPVSSGYVKVFGYNNGTGNVIVLDSAQIQSNGSYILNNVPQSDVYIGAVPNSSPPSDYVFTYYPSSIYWEKATKLHPTGNLTNINVNVYRLTSTSSSNNISGKVNSTSPVTPLKDANLYAKLGNNFYGFKSTGSNGVYNITSLPSGSLKIIADRMGYKSDSITVNLSDNFLDSVNFYLTKVSIGITPISNLIPDKYRLYQNYPNPFNPNTILRFQIKDLKFVTLKVYNILGKEVATLVNEKLKPGEYEVTFDGSGLASGIYFYKLITGDFVQARKMLMIK